MTTKARPAQLHTSATEARSDDEKLHQAGHGGSYTRDAAGVVTRAEGTQPAVVTSRKPLTDDKGNPVPAKNTGAAAPSAGSAD